MSTERLDIVVRENGSRVVKRDISAIGPAATGAARGVKLLQTALLGLGAGAALTFLQRQLDLYTDIQNRLRLVTHGTSELTAVTKELFAVSNRTRISYEATASIYSRVALAAKDMGVSQQRLLQFTESLNQAVILSGASTEEAHAAMIQLSQGMASGTLRGDELRSVLEQLPFVADVIAKHLGITRGQLRILGQEGKITAKTILDAFQAARGELNDKFAKTVPTIGQSFVVLKNKVLEFLGAANQTTGASAAVSRAILLIANNLDKLVIALELAVTAFALWRAAMAVSALYTYIRGLMAVQMALGATAAQAFTTGVIMRGLNALLVGLQAALPVLAITAAAAGLVALANDAWSARAALDGLKDSGDQARDMLLDAKDKARAAGIQVGVLNVAGATGNPIFRDIATAYGMAAEAADRLARSARNAAIAVAQGEILKRKVELRKLEGPLDQIQSSNPLTAFVGTVRQGVGEAFFGGPTIGERVAGADNLRSQISDLQQTIDIYKQLPEDAFAESPLKEPPGTGNDKKKKGGGQTRAEFLDELNRKTNTSIGLTGTLDERWRGVQSQLADVNEQMLQSDWAGLTQDETAALAKKLIALRENEDLMRTRDALAARFTEAEKELNRVQTAGKQLVDAGVISMGQYNDAVADARLAVLDLGKSAEEGIDRGILRLTKELQDEASRTERAVQSIWQNTRGPQLAYEAGLKAIDELQGENIISANEARRAIRDLRIEYLQTRTDLSSGLELGRLQVQANNENVGGRVARSYQSEYEAANSELQQLQDRQAALKQLMQDDPINSGQYAQQLGIVGAQMQALLPGADAFDQARAALADFVADYKGMLPGLRQAFGHTFQQIGDGIANALSRAIVYGENLRESLSNVARQALSELIAALIKLGIQWLVMQVIGVGSQAAISAAGVAAGAAVTAAWIPAAAAVSLATFGANAGPAMAGIASTFALTNALGMAAGKGFREGGYTGDIGAGDVAGVVHGREFVFDADAVSRLGVPFLEALRSGKGYRTGGYVKPLSGSAMAGSRGSMAPADGYREGDTVFNIDARGAESGVEEKIREALAEAEPQFLAKARKQEAKVDKAKSRQRIGGAY